MARDCALDQNEVLLRKYFQYAQVLHLDALTTGTPGHTHAFEYPCRVRGSTNRTWCTLPVVLAVGSVIHTAETVALNNPLKAFTLGSTNRAHEVALVEHLVDLDNVADGFLYDIKLPEFNRFLLRTCLCFVVVPLECFGCVFDLGIAVAYLEGVVAVRFVCLYLRHHARTGFYDGAGNVPSLSVKDAGHSYLFTNYTVHQHMVFLVRSYGFPGNKWHAEQQWILPFLPTYSRTAKEKSLAVRFTITVR